MGEKILSCCCETPWQSGLKMCTPYVFIQQLKCIRCHQVSMLGMKEAGLHGDGQELTVSQGKTSMWEYKQGRCETLSKILQEKKWLVDLSML